MLEQQGANVARFPTKLSNVGTAPANAYRNLDRRRIQGMGNCHYLLPEGTCHSVCTSKYIHNYKVIPIRGCTSEIS